MTMIPGTDWGSYLSWDEHIQFDWDALIDAGLRFCSHKGDQEELSEQGNYSTLRNIKAAQDAGLRVNGCYYWHFPHVKQAYWIDQYKRAIEREKPDFIEVDAEQTSYLGNDGLWHVVDPQMAADTLLQLCDSLSSAFPELPFLLYTRPDYIKKYAAPAIPYINKYNLHIAAWMDWGLDCYPMLLDAITNGYMRRVLDYTVKPLPWDIVNLYDGYEPSQITDKDRCIIWQTSSRILPDYNGKSDYARHQYDWNFFLGTEAELYAWAKKSTNGGGEVTPPPETGGNEMARIYNVNTAIKDRARVAKVNANQKPLVTWDKLGGEAVNLEMGGMPYIDGKCIPSASTSFSTRCLDAAPFMPVFGRFELDAGAWLRGQLGATELEKPIKENIILKAIVDGWHNGGWTWDKVLSKQGNWLPVSALVLELTEDVGYNGLVSDLWQGKMMEEVVNKILYLQDGGFAPKVPIILYTHTWFIQEYANEFRAALKRKSDRIYMGIGDFKLTSTAVFDNLETLFTFRPAADYVYPVVPDGYGERVLFHEYSYQAQKVKTIVNADGLPSAVDLALWCDTPAALREFVGFTGEVPPEEGGTEPPVIPPTTNTEKLRLAVIALSDKVAQAAVLLDEIANLI